MIDYADGGPTHTDNGVLLCWWHHHHLEQSGWQIRMNQAVPEVRAPAWLDPSGGYRPAPNAITRRSRHHRPTPAPPESSGTSAGGQDPGGTRPGAGGNAGEPRSWGRDPGRHPASDTSTGTEKTSGSGRGDASRRGETEDEFAARWDAIAAQTPMETAEERRANWSAPDDEPPWTDNPTTTTNND